jgi:hypothetical protein
MDDLRKSFSKKKHYVCMFDAAELRKFRSGPKNTILLKKRGALRPLPKLLH